MLPHLQSSARATRQSHIGFNMTIGSAQPHNYDLQLQDKITQTESEFAQFDLPGLDVFRSPKDYFRMRAEFKVWYSKETEQADFVMHNPKNPQELVVIEHYSIGSTRINELMAALRQEINNDPVLRHKLFQAEFLTATTGEAVITLIYHKPVSEQWKIKAQQLSKTLNCSVIGRSRKQKFVVGKDYIYENMRVGDKLYQYQQVETGFTQPNANVCEKMLNWACDSVAGVGGDLLELYCGNGNFTLPLAAHFDKVLATEISKTSVNSALHNMDINDVDNIKIARMSSEEFTQALNGAREFRRLKEIDLTSYNFTTIFVDPPRAGLDSETEELASRFNNILYISCNPETLKTNLTFLSDTHKIERFALFDQFPYTHHRECGVWLRRR